MSKSNLLESVSTALSTLLVDACSFVTLAHHDAQRTALDALECEFAAAIADQPAGCSTGT
jgi:hypothetical protein